MQGGGAEPCRHDAADPTSVLVFASLFSLIILVCRSGAQVQSRPYHGSASTSCDGGTHLPVLPHRILQSGKWSLGAFASGGHNGVREQFPLCEQGSMNDMS